MTQISEIQAEFVKALEHINTANQAGISDIENARAAEREKAQESLKEGISTATDNAQADLEAFEAVKAEREEEIDALYDNIKGGEGTDLSYNFAATRARIESEGTEVNDAIEAAGNHATDHLGSVVETYGEEPSADFEAAFNDVFGGEG